MRFCNKRIFALAALSASAFVPFQPVRAAEDAAAAPAAAEDPAAKEELRYINELVDANMPDFAEPVIAAAKKKWPHLGPKLKVLELQGALRLGKFDEVQKVVNGMKDKKSGEYWALRLSMADAYYARSMMKECRAIYQEFFKAVPNPGPDLIDFYVESGFKWAQICVQERNFDEAIRMYGGLLARKNQLPEERWCAVAMENVDLLLRLASEIPLTSKDKKALAKREEYLKTATTYVNEMLWKNDLIIVFGKAISMKAHIELLRGNLEKAQDLVNEYMPQLSEIHSSLVEQDPDGRQGYVRMSPMPECRYLLAKVMWEEVQVEAKKAKPDKALMADALFGAKRNGKRSGAGAYNHAINVFVKYPESSWAASAGELAETMGKFVKTTFGKEIKTNITPAQMKKVRQMQFANAFESYKDGDYKKAVKAYQDILAQFPEKEESVGAVAILAECYLNLWQNEKPGKEKEARRVEANAVEGYLAERFSGMKADFTKTAGDEVLRLAAKERDLGALARSQQMYDAYFHYYPSHYNASQMALSLAGQAMKAEDWEKAIHFYEFVANIYTNSPYYASALQWLSVCNGKLGNVEAQENWLRKFAGATKKDVERTTAQLNLAKMEQKRGFADFARAAETNDVEAAEAINRAAFKGVASAIKDFNAVAKDVRDILAKKKIADAKEKARFERDLEQAVFLEAQSWQRLQYPTNRLSTYRAKAAAAYETYLKDNPKGEWAARALVQIGTIWTAEKDMEKSQEAFARLQRDFPESDEAKNSVPRLAKTLIEMGLRAEGVAQYKQMLTTPGGKYTARQFREAGDALLDAKGWDVAQEAFQKSLELAKGQSNETAYVAYALLGQAKASVGAQNYAEAHQRLEDFTEKYPKSALVVEAYELLIKVAAEEGRREKDDDLRRKYFNAAISALKKVRGYRRTQADQDVLDLRSADIIVNKMEAEDALGLKAQAVESCRDAVSRFQTFLMAHEPTDEHPAKDMTAAQLANLERCYSSVLPLMARLGKEQSELILKYGNAYLEYFPNGRHKTAVQNALNQAQADK